MRFYTNFFRKADTLYLRERVDGVDTFTKKQINPILYIKSNKETGIKSLYNDDLKPVNFGSVLEAREFIDECQSMKMPLFGFPRFEYEEVNRIYPGDEDLEFDISQMCIATIDIETEVENGVFPEPSLAQERVSLITLHKSGKGAKIFSLWDETIEFEETEVIYCKTEKELLLQFLAYWIEDYPDIVTGWNSTTFDMVYLFNRMAQIIPGMNKRLSPWGICTVREHTGKFGAMQQKIEIRGISQLDYLELYQKFTYSVQPSYKLDDIAELELGRKKLENPYNSFREHYKKDPKSFVLYNRIDVDLVQGIDEKNKFIELAASVAYSSKINLEDVYKNIRVWDVVIGNYLTNNNMHGVAYFERIEADQFEGAFVKEPLVGKYNWIASFDLESLYPSIIMQQNMSPELFLGKSYPMSSSDVLNKSTTYEAAYEQAVSLDATLCANGAMFRRGLQGVIPMLIEKKFNERKKAKKIMLEQSSVLEEIKAEKLKRGLS